MPWNDDPTHPFAGITEKLKRADQNIVNLNGEISLFIKNGKYPVLPRPQDHELLKKAVAYHRNKVIPLQFSVLVGEIVHHLRSCLDHVIWHFADASGRATGVIEFPIFETEPREKREIERYKRKIKGITNANVLRLIEEMQPYNVGADVMNHALLIIHNMDRFDKHRELVIIGSSVDVDFGRAPRELRIRAELYSQGKLPDVEHLGLSRELGYYKATPGVAFQTFGEWRAYPVVKGLASLLVAVDRAVDAFACEI